MSWIVGELTSRGGAVPFREFMELALYHPGRGYYARERLPVGRDGDFLTAPSASHWYGTVLGGLLERAAERLGGLTVVDVAAAGGELVESLLGRLPGRHLAGIAAVERSATRRAELERRLAPRGVLVAPSLAALPRPSGATVMHACELYDAFPVDRVVSRGGALAQLWVEVRGEGLGWAERPAPPELAAYLLGHGVTLADGQVAELNLAAEPAHRGLLHWAGDRGLSIVLDYGYPAKRLYDPRGRSGGSLATYRGHRLGRDPLAAPGEQDLTAHVNWDDLRRAGDACGWREIGLWALAELLVRAGLERELARLGLDETAPLDARTVAERQELKRLLDPDGMGSDLKALVQAGPAVAADAAALFGC